MADIIGRLKEKLNVSSTSTIPEIQFLEKSDLCSALNRGFIELYHTQPKNPILFLSKFLQKESKAKELKKKLKQEDLYREKLEKIFIEKEKKKEEENKKREETKKKYEGKQNDLLKQIESCEDFYLGFNKICEDLKVLVNTTGVYIALYDLKRKEVSEEDDEKVILNHQILK